MAAEYGASGQSAIRAPAATLSVFAWGLQFALFNPAIALVLSHRFEADDGQIGLALLAYNASGFVSTLIIPALADRRGRYAGTVLWAGGLSLVLLLLLALAPTFAFAAIGLLLVGGPTSVSSSMLFAHLQSAGAPQEVVLRARAVLSFAWVVGPPLATAIVSIWGTAWLLLAVAMDVVGGLLATLWLRGQGPANAKSATERGHGWWVNRRSVLVPVCIAFVLLQATNYVVTTSLALFVGGTMHVAVVWAGIALAVSATLEVPILMLVSRWSRLVPNRWLLTGACVAGIAFYLLVALASNVIGLLLAQILNAVFFAIVAGVGLTTFQELIPRPGMASGLFTNVRRIGAMLSGGIIALAPYLGGLRGVYGLCSGLVLISAAIIVWRLGANRTPRNLSRQA